MNPQGFNYGLLSENDIQDAILDGSLKIYPFNRSNLTGIGYNLGTIDFFLSVRKGIIQKVYDSAVGRYVRIAPNDTVLTFTQEYVEVNPSIAGTFHSKVSRVCQGLGHISTTLDPNWKGQLIISINNPTGKYIDLFIDKPKQYGNIVTMLLYRLASPIVDGRMGHDNNEGRGDMLMSYLKQPPFAALFKRKSERLCNFIMNTFIKSLNGNDGFIDTTDNKEPETYSLVVIKTSLLDDLHKISLGTYNICPGGTYFPLTDEQKKIIKRSVLYKIMLSQGGDRDLQNVMNDGIHSNIIADVTCAQREIQPNIQKLIDIVDYELATINHNRRLKMQNESIVEFYKSPNARQIFGRICLSTLALIFIGLQTSSLFLLMPKTDVEIIAALIGMFATIDIAVASYFVNKWRSL